jgi:hypothetical protein
MVSIRAKERGMAQPNMGDRKLYYTRLPSDLVELFEGDALQAGLSYSQFLADLVARCYGHPRPSERFESKKARRARLQHEELPIDQAC